MVQPLTFTCTTVGSSLLIWSTRHYIHDRGAELFFSSEEMLGTSKPSLNGACFGFANLTMVNSSDPVMIESQLHIEVLDQYNTSQIICINNARDVNVTITFSVGKYSTTYIY